MKNYDKLGRKLLLSASVPAIVLLSTAPAYAGDVDVAGTTTAAVVNTDINANPDPDLNLNIKAGAEVTGGIVVVNPGGGVNDGAITVTNAGNLGTVDGMGNVTAVSGLDLRGTSDPTKTGNTLNLTNAGLVTNNIFAGTFSAFGGDVTVVNSGTVFGFSGIEARSFGNASIDSSAGTVRSGGVSARSVADSNTVVDKAGVQTTTITSGTADVKVGDVVSADGKSRGNVAAVSEANNASATVSGTAGSVSATAASNSNTVFQSNPAMAGMTVTTFQSDSSNPAGNASVTITKTGDVTNVVASSFGAGSAEVVIDGKVSGPGSVTSRAIIGDDTTFVQTQTRNAANITTESTFDNSRTNVSGSASLKVGATGQVDTNSVTVDGKDGASAVIDGNVKTGNSFSVRSNRSDSTFSQVQTFDDKTGLITTSNKNVSTSAAVGGDASLEVGKAGTLESPFITVSGDKSATATNKGGMTILGQVTVDAFRQITDSSASTSTSDKTGILTTSNMSTRVGVGGPALIDNLEDAKIDINGGFQHRIEGLTSAGLNNAGEIIGSTRTDATHNIFSSSTQNDFKTDSATMPTKTETSSAVTDITVGGAANLNNTATATLDGSFHTVDGLTSATVVNAGQITGNLSARTTSFIRTNEQTNANSTVTDAKAMVTTSVTSGSTKNSTKRTGGNTTVTNAEDATIDGRVTLQSEMDSTLTNEGDITGFTSVSANISESSNSSVNSSKNVVDAKNMVTTSETSFSNESENKNTGGSSIITNAAGAKIDDGLSSFANTDSTVTNAGSITANVRQTTSGSENTSKTTGSSKTVDNKMTMIRTIDTNSASENNNTQTGGSTVLTNAAGATIGNGVTHNANANSTLTNDGTINGFVSLRTSGSENSFSSSSTGQSVDNGMTKISTTDSSNKSESAVRATGGDISFTNTASGLTDKGSSNFNAHGDITISNAGIMRGTIFAGTSGFDNSNTNMDSSSFVTDMSDAKNTVRMNEFTSSGTNMSKAIGGDITGTYSGTNGTLNFSPAANGSITQNAQGNSTATISGAVFGNVNSNAGLGFTNESSFINMNKSTSDDNGDGSDSSTSSSSNSQNNINGGTSTILVTGSVRQGNSGSGGSINSSATDASTVTADGARVSGNISSRSENSSTKSENANSYSRTSKAFVTTTDQLSGSNSSSVIEDGGAAAVSIINGSEVGGRVTASGVGDTSVTVSADSKVDSTVSANANLGTDRNDSTTENYMRDSKTGDVTATREVSSASAPSAAAGNASVELAGVIGGDVDVFANRGNATANITGSVGDDVFANAVGTEFANTTRDYYTGNVKAPASGSTSFFTLVNQAGVNNNKTVSSNSNTTVGGVAAITIDTAAALQDMGEFGAGDDVSARGLGGASIEVLNGSTVGGDASAISAFVNSSSMTTTTRSAAGRVDLLRENVTMGVGGAASILNNGNIQNGADAFGRTSATITNNGIIGDPGPSIFGFADVFANAIGTDSTITTIDLNTQNPALRDQTVTTTFTAVGGTAEVNNNSGAVIEGDTSVAGDTGTVNNDGIIIGTISAGSAVRNYTTVTTNTAGSTSETFMLPATLFQQDYTINQNAYSGGVFINGATVNHTDAGTGVTTEVQTSDINATVNLNDGSVTLGNVDAQRDDADDNLTTSVVNLNGNGYWGLDVINLVPTSPGQALATPRFTIPLDVQEAIGGIGGFAGGDGVLFPGAIANAALNVRGLGLTEINKDGAGTFVITGAAFQPPAAPGQLAAWTLDADNINVNAGELQLNLGFNASAVAAMGNAPLFGISGNINNSGNIVVGRRVDVQQSTFGQNLVQTGPQVIQGINIFQEGNYNQSASGTTTFGGINGALVRIAPLGINEGFTALEPFGPVSALTNIPFFTVPGSAGLPVSTASHVEIIGDLNLAGMVAFTVTQDNIFLDGDGAELFSYTGTGNVSAVAAPSMESNFVNFDVVHDTTAQTVSIVANRSSYGTAGDNLNAISAATGLDSAFSTAVNNIRNDALGLGGFSSVTQLGYAQDIANIGSALDYRLSAAQASQVANELSGGEIHGSLSAVNQSVVTDIPHETAKLAILGGDEVASRAYFNPFVRSATLGGGEAFGASDIEVDSLGGSVGADFAYSPNGIIGFTFGYGEHDVEAVNTQETAEIDTFTAGVYGTHKFGNVYGSVDFSYSASTVETERELALLSRTITAEYDANQLDGALEVGYVFKFENGWIASPYGRIAGRNWDTDGFTEEDGGGVSLDVAEASNTVFSPTLGGRASTQFDAGSFKIRPYADLSYTFQGNVGGDRSVNFVAGGNAFNLLGVDPDGFGTIDGGFTATVNDAFDIFVGVSHSFSGDNKETNARAGGGFKF